MTNPVTQSLTATLKNRSERRSAPRPWLAASSYKKSLTRNHQLGGDAATVAGDAGPGLHNWPLGHTNQDADTNALIRIQFPQKNNSR
jgi:hypothetical protein